MALITSYSTLKTEIGNWLNRSDLVNDIPTFIQLAESTIARTLRTKHKTIQTITTVAGTGSYTLQGNVIENYSAYVTTPENKAGELDVVARGKLYDNRRLNTGSNNRPTLISVLDTDILLSPIPDGVYTIEIVQELLAALSDAAPTNFVLLSYPDVYLYGALVHSAPFLKDDPRIPVWQEFMNKALRELRLAAERNEYPHTPKAKLTLNLAPIDVIKGR